MNNEDIKHLIDEKMAAGWTEDEISIWLDSLKKDEAQPSDNQSAIL